MGVKVKVVQLGKGVVVCDLSPGATVREALESQGIPVEGMETRVNAESSVLEQSLEDGDVLTIVPMIKGGDHPPPARLGGDHRYVRPGDAEGGRSDDRL